jgi:hypothetical protein
VSTENEVAPVSHTDAAQACVEEIRAMREKIPHFVVPSDKGELRRLIRAATIPPEFVELTAVAVKNAVELAREGGADPARTRDLMSYAKAYLPVAGELEVLAQFIRHSCVVARNKAGSDALTTFALARRLAKRPEMAHLAPHVEDMRRALGGRGPKRKAQPVAASTESAGAADASPETPEAGAGTAESTEQAKQADGRRR